MGMGGVQRTAKFVKYLPLYGWKPFVLTVAPKQYLASDECLLRDVDNGHTRIFRTGAIITKEGNGKTKVVEFKTDNRRKFLSNFSQVFLIPDSKVLWKRKALELAKKIVKENNIELIYATAPPYTDFLIAKELKKTFGLPVVLDYRDSWIDCPNNYYATPLHKSIHRKMETGVLKSADKIVTINSRIKELIRERYPFRLDEDFVIIPQGFDSEDFSIKDKLPEKKKMRFTYAGSFMNYYTPKYFLEGLSLLFKARPELKDKIEACFLGSFPNEYKSLIDEYGLSEAVNLMGYVEHSECVKYELNSDVLWMMINKTERSDLHSTGKLYEYFGAGKPILACVPEGVAKQSLANYNAVRICRPDDSKAIAKAIEEFYDLYTSGKMPIPNKDVINKYDRQKLTGELAGVFENVLMKTQTDETAVPGEDKINLAHT
jgi:glycosyltransferase involved in cell wall biosynthesis